MLARKKTMPHPDILPNSPLRRLYTYASSSGNFASAGPLLPQLILCPDTEQALLLLAGDVTTTSLLIIDTRRGKVLGTSTRSSACLNRPFTWQYSTRVPLRGQHPLEPYPECINTSESPTDEFLLFSSLSHQSFPCYPVLKFYFHLSFLVVHSTNCHTLQCS